MNRTQLAARRQRQVDVGIDVLYRFGAGDTCQVQSAYSECLLDGDTWRLAPQHDTSKCDCFEDDGEQRKSKRFLACGPTYYVCSNHREHAG